MRIACIAALICTGCTLHAQELSELSGFVWDSTGALVPAAGVTVVSEETGFRRVTTSSGAGAFQVAYLQPGHYKVTVRKEGFRTLVKFGLQLDAGQGLRADFHLELGSVDDVITVRDEPGMLNTDDASLGTLVGRNWIDGLPLEGRGLLSLVELAPGTVATPASTGEAGQFTVNGQRPNTNFFTVDGVSANTGVSGGLPAQMPGGSLPNMTAFGSLHALTPVEGLDEFRLGTSTVTSEHGRSAGGEVELSSRSGSNEFHGSLNETFRNQSLDANDWFANRLGSERQPLLFQDLGITAGGPLLRNRTFFFASYEGLRLRQPYTWQSAVPSLDARAAAPASLQPLLNAFPVPNGPDLGGGIAGWTGSSSRPSTFDGGTLRIDHALSGNVLLFARYARTPSSTEFGASQIESIHIDSQSITGGLNAVLSPSAMNELRVNSTLTTADSGWLNQQPLSGPCFADVALLGASAPCASFYRFSIDGIGEFVAGGAARDRQWQTSFFDSTQIRRGSHEWRFGADVRRLALGRDSASSGLNINAASVQALLDSKFSIALWQASQHSAALIQGALFAEDTWRISPRLTLTGGIRWDLDRIQPPSYANFAPNIGAAYRLGSSGKTVLRAGWGIYNDPNFGAATDQINGAPYNVWQFNSLVTGGSNTQPQAVINYAFDRGLHVPSSQEWNATIERALTAGDVVTASYVGAHSADLLRREVQFRGDATNETILATNHGRSNYDALELQYRRRLDRAWQTLVSYTWGHSLDNGSADSALFWAPAPSDWASSDFDVRRTFSAAIMWRTHSACRVETRLDACSLQSLLLRGWSVDGIFHARSGFPINVIDSETVNGLSFANIYRPNLIAGVPVWLSDPAAPSGKRLNSAAFAALASAQGNLGRNALTGFGTSQIDLSLHRTFALSEHGSIEFGAEAFNLLNQPAFADPVRFLSNPLFGRSTSMMNLMLGSGTPNTGLTPAFQAGGPRSIQLTLRFRI